MTTLEQENRRLKQEVLLLQAELAQLKKLVFGARRERFVTDQNPNQGLLFEDSQAPEALVTEVKAVAAPASQKAKTKKVVKRNTFPESLPRKIEVIELEGVDLENMVKIGEDITEILAYIPGSIQVNQLIRPRLVEKGNEEAGVRQAPIPPRLIPKGIVDESLIAHLMTEKILFHTPIHRFRKKLKQAGVDFVSEQNLYNWFHSAASQLLPLCHLLKADLLKHNYLQCDETGIQVLSKNKPGASLRGQMWVINQPQLQAVYFEYHPSRSTNAAQALLEGFEGILQVDGYTSYENLAKRTAALELVYCMAHARRKFYDAKNTDPPRADYFLSRVQLLYDVERQAREEQLTHEQRQRVRQDKSTPVLEELGLWLKNQLSDPSLLPKSPIGKAISYALQRWEGLSAYAHKGHLEIDNNLIENRIRPVALGRKNYLFAASDEYAQHLACLYSIIGTAEKYGVNMQRYITWLLKQIATNKITDDAIQWLPHRMKPENLSNFID